MFDFLGNSKKLPAKVGLSKNEYIYNQLLHLTYYWLSAVLLVGAFLFLLFGIVDFFVTPENFSRFFLLRVSCSTILIILSVLNWALGKNTLSVLRIYPIIIAAILVSAATIEIMILNLDGHKSFYYAGLSLIVISALAFIPLNLTFSTICVGLVHLMYIVPIFIFDTITALPVFISNNFFLIATFAIALLWRGSVQKTLIKTFTLQFELQKDKETLQLYSGNLEHLIKERTKELNKSEQMLRSLFEQANDGIIITDSKGTIININRKACEIHGFPKEALIGANIRLIEAEQDHKLFKQRYQRILNGESFIFETRHLKKDGSAISVEVSSKAIEIDGKTYIQSLHRNITDKKKMQKQLLHSQKMDSIGQLAGGISHDFKNILTSIISMAEVTLRMDNLNEFATSNIKMIEQAGRRGTQIVSQLLSFARRGVSDALPLNCNNVIESTCDMLSRLVPKEISLIRQLQEPLPAIEGDVTQIEQVLMNMILNARDSMQGEGKLKIKTETVYLNKNNLDIATEVKPDDYVLITVSDTGCGIPQENLSRIFDPFFTTKVEGKGTGLGLAMVYGIIKEHNGYITVTSPPDKGTTFNIYLPAMKERRSDQNLPENRIEEDLDQDIDLSRLLQ